MRRSTRLAIVGSLLAVACVAVGIAYAAIPNGGIITGCFAKSGGGLRVIDATVTNCKANTESKLEWNVKGDKGDPGTNGTNGADGAAGTASANIHKTSQSIGANSGRMVTASCLSGEVAVSGGFYVGQGNLTASYPLATAAPVQDGSTPDAWRIEVGNPTASAISVDVYVVCT